MRRAGALGLGTLDIAEISLYLQNHQIRGSIVVSIPACHAGDPGSIPGRGVFRSALCAHILQAKAKSRILA